MIPKMAARIARMKQSFGRGPGAAVHVMHCAGRASMLRRRAALHWGHNLFAQPGSRAADAPEFAEKLRESAALASQVVRCHMSAFDQGRYHDPGRGCRSVGQD